MYQTQSAGGLVLKACDYLGEGLANFFGITRPKYEYEIEEYKRTLQEVMPLFCPLYFSTIRL